MKPARLETSSCVSSHSHARAATYTDIS